MRNGIRKRLGTKRQSTPTRKPSGSLWPNGEFGLGYYSDQVINENENEWMWAQDGELSERSPDLEEAVRSITSSDAPNSEKRGLKGITTYGARNLRSAAYLLETRLGRSDCALWTFTLPCLSASGRRSMSESWGKVTNELVKTFTRRLVHAGRSPSIAGCVEIQTARMERTGEAYLHIHLICPLWSNEWAGYAVDVDRVRGWWHRCIERFSGEELNTMPRVQVEQVRKSMEGYIGKYLSKGSQSELDAFIADLGPDAVPGQWWFASSTMKKAIKASTHRGSAFGALMENVISYAFREGCLDAFEYIRHVDVEIDGVRYTAGYYGKLKPGAVASIVKMLSLPLAPR